MNGLLKFITCGSVDDGKSTLIGHLLYDAKLIYADQEKALELDSKVGSRAGAIDYSLLLDGLIAEREQGITIDVAYRYFTTDHRSFIVADTPGHEEYTRNMAVGASFADLAVLLIDAEHGVLIQTKRHARICALMGIRNFVFAVNKMDLAGYREQRFEEIKAQIQELEQALSLKRVQIIPVSATEGDNITIPSENMPWYQGPTLLEYLENVDISETEDELGFYMPVQRVCRPSHEFRGFQGQIESGEVKVNDRIVSLPSREHAHVKQILVAGKSVTEAGKGQPVTISLDREVDVSRGCVLSSGADILGASQFQAEILWMDDAVCYSGKNFMVKIGTKLVPGIVTRIAHRIDISTGEHQDADALYKNEIAVCDITLTEAVVVDEFRKHKTLGELILIDRISNMTSACGVITKVQAQAATPEEGKIGRYQRSVLLGQVPVTIGFHLERDSLSLSFVEEIERGLIARGRHTCLYEPQPGAAVGQVLHQLSEAGIIVLLALHENLNVDAMLEEKSYYYDYTQLSQEKKAGDVVKAIMDRTDFYIATDWSI